MQRSTVPRLPFQEAGLPPNALRIEIDQGVQYRIQPFNLTDMSFGQINNGNFADTKEFKLAGRWKQNEISHLCLVRGYRARTGISLLSPLRNRTGSARLAPVSSHSGDKRHNSLVLGSEQRRPIVNGYAQ